MKEVIYMLLLIGCILYPVIVDSQTTYTIGIQDTYFATSQVATTLTGNNLIKFVSVTIADSNDFTTLAATTSTLFAQQIDYLIYSYSRTASLVTNNMFTSNKKVIPYLVLPVMPDNPVFNQNMFYIDYPDKISSDATRALLTYLNISSIVYIDYWLSPTANYLVSYNVFDITLTTIVAVSTVPDLLVSIFTNNTKNAYVCSIPLDQSATIFSLLTEAMFKGQLNPGKTWIFNRVGSTASLFPQFQQFALVGADIYGFGITYPSGAVFLNGSQYAPFVARDYVRVIASSFNNSATKPTNLTVPLLTAVASGEIITNGFFNNSTHLLSGITLNAMKVNANPNPIPRFIYNGTLYESNINTLVRKLNHSSVTVRIGVILTKAYFMQNSQGGYYGFSMALLTELLKLTNFKYVFVFPNDNVTGEVVTWNGSVATYRGIVAMLNQKLVDMTIIPMVATNIGNVITASSPIMNLQLSYLTRPANETAYFLLIFVPFTFNVWFGIALIIFIMTLAFYCVNKISPNHSKDGKNEKVETYSFFFSLLIIYSSFVTAKLKVKPNNSSLHILAFILWFSTLTLVITYASNMLPFLLKPSKQYPFNDIVELVNNYVNNGYNWGFVNDTIDIEIIKNNTILSQMYNISLSNWPNQMFVSNTNSESALAINQYVLVQDFNKNRYLYNRVCNTSIPKIVTAAIPQVLAMNPSWPQAPEMKGLIDQLLSAGTITLIQNRYFALGPCAKDIASQTPEPVALSILGSLGLFMLPTAGIVIGLICVLCHYAIIKIGRCRKNMTFDKFKYGETYTGEVNSVEPNGVWAIINGRDRPYFISSTSLHADLKRKYTPEELGIKATDKIELKYFGKDPVNGYKRFCKYTDEENV